MSEHTIKKFLKSRWDARFLIKSTIGLLKSLDQTDADVVMAVVTGAIRGYSKAYHGKKDRAHEEGIYRTLKEYAAGRVCANGRDAESMANFLSVIGQAESQLWGDEYILLERPTGSFPMDCLTYEEEEIIRSRSQELFKAKLYCSDGTPEIGFLVFEDQDALESFSQWMDERHSELKHQIKGEED